ncbi:MAG: NADH-quinone oxidoreductase subunit NuoK [Ignavibacteria bacterium]|nr:NADH-quinone oxidoreductase subunit NuoK [Ignavibacteria bacterium]
MGAQHIGLPHFLIVGAILFALGVFAIITRKNAIMVLMGLELILNAANINFVAFSRFGGMNYDGQIAAIFVIVLAAAEVAVALAIILNIYQTYKHINVDEIVELKK